MSESPKKAAAKVKKPADHPKYSEMVVAAVTALKERGGSSRQKIIKYIEANYKVNDNNKVYIKQALKKLVSNGMLVQSKGTGASGSFKLGEKPKKPVKKPVTKKKTPVKKPAAAAVKKTTAKKPAAKKTPTKKKATTKKTPTKKTAAKKPATKKPAPKKAAAKKVTKKTPKKTGAKKSKK